MGNIEYGALPKYIAVQVTTHRWQIATLRDKHSEFKLPVYVTSSEKMTQSQCAATLTHLQAKEQQA